MQHLLQHLPVSGALLKGTLALRAAAGGLVGGAPPYMSIGAPAAGVGASADSLSRIPHLFKEADKNGNGFLGTCQRMRS